MKYYKLKYIGDGCRRRDLFNLLNKEGIKQYYPYKKRYIKSKIYRHIADRFKIDNPYNPSIPDQFVDRVKESEEKANNLIGTLDGMIDKYGIEIKTLGKKATYETKGKKIEFTIDAIGMFESQLSFFTINITSRSKTDNLKKLVFIEPFTNFTTQRIIELKLGSGKYREAPKNGERTKNGRLKKRGLNPWVDIAREGKKEIKDALKTIEDMKGNPQKYNIPTFGKCATCPYHNISIEFDGETIICVG
jgi:hypothetical protein